MRRIVILVLIFTITQSSSLCYSQQIGNCSIEILNANGLREIYTVVKLTSFKDDILSFRTQDSLYKVNIKEIISLEYPGKSTSSKGLIIGASIGCAIGIAAVFALRGITSHGSEQKKTNAFHLMGGGLFFAAIGGLIGGSIQGAFNERNKVNFSGMSAKDVRRKLDSIFNVYGE